MEIKRFAALLLALVMVFALVACTGTPEESKTPDTTTAAKPADDQPSDTKLEDTDHAAWVAHGQFLLADGTENGWNGKDSELYKASALTAISMKDAKDLNEDLYTALAAKDVKYLYSIDLLFGTNDAGWTTKFMQDGKKFLANGSYAFKIAQCSVDEEVYAEDQWISDPKTAHAESLTPATLFIPAWQEEADENGFSWADNPVVIGGPGLYTLVIAQYANASSPEQAGFGIALIKKEDKEGQAYEEILQYVPAEHTYGIIGGFNDWGGDVAMEAAGDNAWAGEVELTAGTEFKVRADADWTYSWGDPNTESGNCACEADGTYVVTITFDADGNGTVTVAAK